MRLMTLATIMVLMTLSIMIFDNTGTVDTSSPDLQYYDSADAGVNNTSPTFWSYIINPVNLLDSSLYNWIWAFFIGLGLVSAIAGLLRYTASDAVTFSPLFLGLLAFSAFPLGVMYGFIQRELSSYMCYQGSFCMMPTVIAIALVGLLAFDWVLGCFKFLRTGFTE